MKQYLYVILICSFIAIWAITGIGCIPAKTIKKDCWDIAVERCLPCVQAGYECEIWLGRLPITPVHAESCIVVAGKRIWLRGVGRNSILLSSDYTPRFEPIYRFSFRQFMNATYMVK